MQHLDLGNPANRNLGRILELQACHQGDALFLRHDDRTISFAQAHLATNAIARGLTSLGIGRGDRVTFFARSTPDLVLLALALNRLGAVWVPINTDYKGVWLCETLVASKARLIVTDETMLPRLMEVIEQVPHDHILLLGDGPGQKCTKPFSLLTNFGTEPIEPLAISAGDVSAILWTSGTTGRSKGVMQSHNAWIANAEDTMSYYQSRPGDIVYDCLPMYNSAAWCTCILRALVHGIGCAIDPHFSVTRFWDRIRFYGATQTFTLGAMHIFLWQQPARLDDRDNPLRAVSMVPMPDDLIAPFCARFGIERMAQAFGQSEALTVLRRIEGERAWPRGALGAPHPDIEVRLVDDGGKCVPTGETGEFALRPAAPHLLFQGYFDDDEATRAAFDGDWYRMGDLGRRDAEGHYFFVDRKRDAVRYKGRNISTLEVEAVAQQHPDVAEVAAFGIPSAEIDSEHELKLDVVPRPGATLDEAALARFINDKAPYFFVPRYIELVASMPYTPTGKIQKYLLRQRGLGNRTWDRQAAGFVLIH